MTYGERAHGGLWGYDGNVRLLVVAFVLTFAVAVTASVFALWSVVDTPPWKTSAAPTVDPIRLERCHAALTLQSDLRANGVLIAGVSRAKTGPRYATAIAQADGDVQQFC